MTAFTEIHFVIQGILILIILNSPDTSGYNILMLPVQTPSHICMFADIGKGLVEKGHQVFTISNRGFREVENITGIKTIYLPCLDEDKCHPDILLEEQTMITSVAIKYDGDIHKLWIAGYHLAKRQSISILTDESFWDSIKDINFDLAIVDGMVLYRSLFLIPHRLGIPWVTLTGMIDPLIVRLPWLPSFVPHSLALYNNKMSFIEKVQNIVFSLNFHFSDPSIPMPAGTIEKYQKYGNFKDFKDLESRSLLWFVINDNAVDYSRPLMPNVINIGGISLQPSKELAPEYKSYIEMSKNGVVFVSFGSFLYELPKEVVQKMLSAFQKIKENVIWHYENKDHLIIPPNVKLTKWNPQNDILAHKKVKLFLSHGGNNGLFEGIYHAKPFVVMPMLSDQLPNAAKVISLGYGIKINLFDFTSDQLYDAIRKVIDNPKFKFNVERASKIYRDQKETPVDRAVFWTEHVLKFGGNHLRSSAFDMPLYEFCMLDLLLVINLVIIFVLSLFTLMCCFMLKYLRRKEVKFVKLD